MTSRILIYNKSSVPDTDLAIGLACDSKNCVTFDNKYFTVSVRVCFAEDLPVEEICDTVEAFVYVVDEPKTEIQSVLNDLDKFKEFLSESNPAVKLLLMNTDEPLHESEFLEWCVEHEFEFIKYIVSDTSQQDGLMGQSEGIGRARAALECHMWPYRTMKDGKSGPTPQADLVRQQAGTVSQTDTPDDFGDFVSGTGFESLMEGGVLDGDFQDMFSNMLKIKEVAEQMPHHEERKKFAEQVAMSFWRAMGGSDDES